jgi:hypothetical protein
MTTDLVRRLWRNILKALKQTNNSNNIKPSILYPVKTSFKNKKQNKYLSRCIQAKRKHDQPGTGGSFL